MPQAVIVFSILAFVGFVIWIRTRDRLERRRLELEAQDKVLERIGPGDALTEFLRTAEGRRFFDRLAAPQSVPPGKKDPRTAVIILSTLGLIALFAGLFVVSALLIPNLLVTDPEISIDVLPLVASPAVLLTGGGIGALIAAWIMRRLTKRWGMPDAPGAESTVD